MKNEYGWFNNYQDIDDFLIKELEKLVLEFPIIENNGNPSLNTIETIKLYAKNFKND